MIPIKPWGGSTSYRGVGRSWRSSGGEGGRSTNADVGVDDDDSGDDDSDDSGWEGGRSTNAENERDKSEDAGNDDWWYQ